MVIQYNMRHRGPLEYDKTVLNILQLSNAVSLLINTELEDSQQGLKQMYEKVNNIYDLIIGKDENEGLSAQLYYQLLNSREC